MRGRAVAFVVVVIVAAGCRSSGRPDIVLVTVDTLRADHLGAWGYRRATSPNLDRLARDGVRFANVTGQGAWTFSALPSLVTSRFPQDHADLWVGGHGAARIAPGAPTFAETLAAEGFHTALVSGHPGFGAIVGLGASFETIDVGDFRASEVTDRGLALLAGRPRDDRPLFLWLHYMDPHTPYDPPPPFDTRFVGDGRYATGRLVPLAPTQIVGLGGIPEAARLGDRRDLDFYVARYDGEIAYVDAQIGRLRHGIEVAGRARRTLVAVLADHGESLGEGDLYFSHTYALSAAILSIPWILAWPGTIPGGRVVTDPAMAVDVVPTLAELIGMTTAGRAWVGRSWAACARQGRCPGPRPAFATRGVEAAIRADPWKLVCATPPGSPIGACRLYDLRADPGEATDVGAAHGEIVAGLRAELSAWRAAHPDNRPRAASGILVDVDERTREALHALGYGP